MVAQRSCCFPIGTTAVLKYTIHTRLCLNDFKWIKFHQQIAIVEQIPWPGLVMSVLNVLAHIPGELRRS